MQSFASEIVSIADSCLGGLLNRSALLIGPEAQLLPYIALLQRAGISRPGMSRTTHPPAHL